MEDNIGRRINTLRQKRQLTLAKLAEMANLSASHLSQIERDKVTPSLVTLTGIASALEVSLRDLFESEADQVRIVRATLTGDEGTDISPGVRSRLTSPENGWDLEVHRLTLYPDAPYLEFEPHLGEVLGFVLKGALTIVIDDEQFELGSGDSIHYDANRPYHLCCSGDGPCTVVWCNSPPRYEMVSGYEAIVEDEHSVESELT
jgi:transcriptional regulator with XRE-family HTH domain